MWAFVISQCTVTTPKFELCIHSMHCNYSIGVLCEVNALQQCNCIHELCVHSIASTATASKLCLHSRAGATLQAPLTKLGNPDWPLGIRRETWYSFCVNWRTDLFFPRTYQGVTFPDHLFSCKIWRETWRSFWFVKGNYHDWKLLWLLKGKLASLGVLNEGTRTQTSM